MMKFFVEKTKKEGCTSDGYRLINRIRFVGSFTNGLKQKGSLWLKANLCSKLIFPFFPQFWAIFDDFSKWPSQKVLQNFEKIGKNCPKLGKINWLICIQRISRLVPKTEKPKIGSPIHH